MNQFEDMQTFIRIVDSGSITKAAEQLNTVKSAVSRRLTELEKRLGVSLLTRTTRSQTLTDSGKSYYQQCIRIIDDLQDVESRIKNEHCALSGKIKISAPLSFGLSHMGAALREFNGLHPDIYFEIDFNDRMIDLVDEGFDLAIRISKLKDSSLIAKKLFTSKSFLCASPQYLAKTGVPKQVSDLENKHVILRYSGTDEHLTIKDPHDKPKTVKIAAVLSANNGDFLCQTAVEGKGLIYTPDFICYKAIQSKQLISILEDKIIDNQISGYAIYPQTRHLSHRVRSLVDYLSLYFADKARWMV